MNILATRYIYNNYRMSDTPILKTIFEIREDGSEHREVLYNTLRARFIHHADLLLKQNVAKMVISIQPFQQYSVPH